MKPHKLLADYSNDELLYELLKLTRRQQWEAEPLRFGTEVFSQHFSKPPAPMHRLILRLVTGVEPPAPGRPVDQTAPGPGVRETGTGQPPGVRESAPSTETSLPFSPPVSALKSVNSPLPPNLDGVHAMNTTP